MIIFSLFYATIMQLTSIPALSHFAIRSILCQAHKTQTKNKRIRFSSVTNQYDMSLENGISA